MYIYLYIYYIKLTNKSHGLGTKKKQIIFCLYHNLLVSIINELNLVIGGQWSPVYLNEG